MLVHVVDPPAYTPPYDRALCAALARAGARVELWTSRFDYAGIPATGLAVPGAGTVHRPGNGAPRGHAAGRSGVAALADGVRVVEAFYGRSWGPVGSRRRRAARVAAHVPDMLRYRRGAQAADVVHFQWLPLQAVDWALLPPRRPRLMTAHDVLPREAGALRRAGQRALYARMDAVVVHSRHGADRLREEAGVEPARIHVIPHGAFHELAAVAPAALPPELGRRGDPAARAPASGGPSDPVAWESGGPSGAAAQHGPGRPVALFFGLMRPYKGIDILLEAWARAERPPGAELWLVGRPRMDVEALRARSPAGVRWVTRFVGDAELAAVFRAADLLVAPYREIEQSGVVFTALAFGLPMLLTAVGGFPEVAETGAAELVAPGDPDALAGALGPLLASPERRAVLADAARRAGAPHGPYGWDAIARRTLALYDALGARGCQGRAAGVDACGARQA